MNIHEDFGRCSCGHPYFYEKKQYLIHKEVLSKKVHYYNETNQLPGIISTKSTIHCSSCDKKQFEIS